MMEVILSLAIILLIQLDAVICHRAEFNKTDALKIHNVNGQEYLLQKINDKTAFFTNVIKNDSTLFTIDLRKSNRKNDFLNSLNELMKDSSRNDHSIKVFNHNGCQLTNKLNNSYFTVHLINKTIMMDDDNVDWPLSTKYINLNVLDSIIKLELRNETILADEHSMNLFKSIRFSFIYYNYILFVSIDRGLIYYFNIERLMNNKSEAIDVNQINIYQVFIDMNHTGLFYEFLDIFRSPIFIEEILFTIFVIVLVICVPTFLIILILIKIKKQRARCRFSNYPMRINYLRHRNINRYNNYFEHNYRNYPIPDHYSLYY